MESNGNGSTATVVTADPIREAFDAYKATGGLLPFEAWYNGTATANGNGQPSKATRKPSNPRKPSKATKPSKASKASKATKPSNPRGIVEKLAAMVGSKARSKARGKHRPSALDAAALAEQHETDSRKVFPLVRAAVKAFEASPLRRDAAVKVAEYFGEGTYKGYTRALWRSVYKTQREAVAMVWRVPTDEAHKAKLDAAVQKMVRLRADGYDILGVNPPEHKPTKEPESEVIKAMANVRKYLAEMTDDEAVEFLGLVRKAVKAKLDGTDDSEAQPSKATKPSKATRKATRKASK